MFTKIRATYQAFPNQFLILVGASFIDKIGGTMLFPFFALYITRRFEVGMTQAGILLAIFSVAGFIGNMLGGGLTDKFGRRGMVIFGLVFSAASSVAMGFVNSLSVFYPLAMVAGLLSSIADPAQQAMVADLLPEDKRAEGFGVWRVVVNLAWIIGPSIGGILAAHSYFALFVLDAITSGITAVIVYRFIPETYVKEEEKADTPESLLTTFVGYWQVAKDRQFLGFIVASMFMLVAYGQIYNTLPVYLRDVHGIPERGYGLLMSLNATAVVLFQFWVMRLLKPVAPLLAMVMGSLLYMVGLTMYGLVSGYGLFVLAMMIVTAGEMVVMPVGQALVANFAPAAMRGRYMAFYGFAWVIPSAVAPWAAGLVMDYYDPNWVWYGSGICSALAAVGFYWLYRQGPAGEAVEATVTDEKEVLAASSG